METSMRHVYLIISLIMARLSSGAGAGPARPAFNDRVLRHNGIQIGARPLPVTCAESPWGCVSAGPVTIQRFPNL